VGDLYGAANSPICYPKFVWEGVVCASTILLQRMSPFVARFDRSLRRRKTFGVEGEDGVIGLRACG
jgi:hypothetical protein